MSLEEDPAGQASHVRGGSWSCWKRREPWVPIEEAIEEAKAKVGGQRQIR